MTGQDFQDRLDAIKTDLQTDGKGKTINIMFRQFGNTPYILPLSSDANGVINLAQLNAVEDFVSDLGALADQYLIDTAPYTAKAAELKAIAESAQYQEARANYKNNNVSENYAELQNAKGAYVA